MSPAPRASTLIPALASALIAAIWLAPAAARADETSATDKMRILYSTRFTFTDDGLPLITVEVMSGKQEVHLHAKSGVLVRPDGEGGSTINASTGGDDWVITATQTKPAQIQD